MERIWGPVNGFYLAAYAAPAGDGERYCSYAKVCWSRPASYWDADCAFKVFGGAGGANCEALNAQPGSGLQYLGGYLAQVLLRGWRYHEE